jgi:carboxymethylenebutenolidase
MSRSWSSLALLGFVGVLGACTVQRAEPDAQFIRQGPTLPASSATVAERLQSSPRHAEWAMIPTGARDSVRAWVVYPERRSNAPVVLVVHEIYGLTAWVRGVADQLAAQGFIAIAPDLLTGRAPLDGDSLTYAVATAQIRTIQPADYHRQLAAVAQYGMNLPAARKVYGIVGYCWGGAASFAHAVRAPAGLAASVVYYGTSPAPADLASVRVPVLGLYADNDQRVNSTIAPADSAMRAMGKSFEHHLYAGAGHGFLRAQNTSTNPAAAAANLAATEQAWPLTVRFFRTHLER